MSTNHRARRWRRLTFVLVAAVLIVMGQRAFVLWDIASLTGRESDAFWNVIQNAWLFPCLGWLVAAPVAAWVGMILPFGRFPWQKLASIHGAVAAAAATGLWLALPARQPLVLVGQVEGPSLLVDGEFRTMGRPGDLPPGLVSMILDSMEFDFEPGDIQFLEAASPPDELMDVGAATHPAVDLSWNAMAWLALVSIAAGWTFRDRLHQRERQAAWVESKLARLEVQTLRTQVHPHFLFNALNSLQLLIAEDPDRALEMVNELADLLRASQRDLQRPLIPLWRELEIVRHYIYVESIRFGDRIEFQVDVHDENSSLAVPPFCLQPLVENALRHGCGALVSGGTIHIQTRIDGSTMRLMVADQCRDPDATSRTAPANEVRDDDGGFGTRSVRTRLQHLFGTHAHLALESTEQGFVSTIAIDLEAGAMTEVAS